MFFEADGNVEPDILQSIFTLKVGTTASQIRSSHIKQNFTLLDTVPTWVL